MMSEVMKFAFTPNLAFNTPYSHIHFTPKYHDHWVCLPAPPTPPPESSLSACDQDGNNFRTRIDVF